MASGHNPSSLLGKARRKLAEALLQVKPELLLNAANSHQLLTQKELFSLSQIKDQQELAGTLLNTVQGKESKHEIFLECLANLRHMVPSLQPISEYLKDERSETLKDIFSKLKLEKHEGKKLSLQEVLEIRSESLKQCAPQRLEDLPWLFLRKVLVLDVTARNTGLEEEGIKDPGKGGMTEVMMFDERMLFPSNMNENISMNPLDVLCAVLLCSDSFLQQEILSKMSLCQFALPLLLPPLETPMCTLMLWAMRDIVKKWRPHSVAESRGFREESLVVASMPTISFVRMGTSSLSKSKLLNEFLCPSQQHHEHFIHRDMECGNIPRKVADGLVEMAWYFPGGQKSLDVFPEPLAVANLHGDVKAHCAQFNFLRQVSSAICIIAESIDKHEYNFLSSLQGSATQYFFILVCHDKKSDETLAFLNKLAPVLNFNNSQMLVKSATTSNAVFVEKLQSVVGQIISSNAKSISIEDMAIIARTLSIQVDEDCQECQKASQCATEITHNIKHVANYKEEMLKLQGDLWKNLSKVEKELCRMERQGDMPLENYRSELKGRLLEIRKQQNKHGLTFDLMKFIDSIKHLTLAEKHYFLKWMKFNLDCITRENLSKLRADYKEKCMILMGNCDIITEIDRQISSSCLGVEHFLRELGQFYEAECSIFKEGKLEKSKQMFVNFPSIAANLMLEGVPLELIDGDASNIPLQWITDVLNEIHNKLKGQSKLMVITVLGVQSTGKSTLLNTMFGLQFAVSSGRCTRGAFMTLLKVREHLTQELGCDFILVIDTEGLKAPELAKLEGSYQHDNELATLVIGLSDITIVNMAMENATEMKDILQIVVHAFLRMEGIGQKPNCQFVHQNVSEVSAHDQNMRDRKHLLEQLNEMTQAAAKMEKINRNIKFSDIMDYDPEMHHWYIPGLWHGVPPMAPVNLGYSDKVIEFKMHLFELIRHLSMERPPKNILQFIEWVKSLWDAVKHENFIFSFQNSLIAEAYTNLSIKYCGWEWGFRKAMHLWLTEQVTVIQNVPPDMLNHSKLKCDLQEKLSAGEQQILENLELYLESGTANMHLIEKYKSDFVRSTKRLMHELESSSYSKLQDAIRMKKGQHKINLALAQYIKTFEEKVDKLLEECRENKCSLKDEELKREFDRMWSKTLFEISPAPLEERQIYEDVEIYLRKEFSSRGISIKKKLQNGKGLFGYRINTFEIKEEHIQSSSADYVKAYIFSKKGYIYAVAAEYADSLKAECISYINEKVSSKSDYDENYFVDLLLMINDRLQQPDVKKLYATSSFEVDLKLHILGEAAYAFHKLHKDFIKENDPQVCLEKLKPWYFIAFRDLYQDKDAQQIRAKCFCDHSLHPGLVDCINKRLGTEIVDYILVGTQSTGYASRMFFQFTVLQDLLEEMDFDNYVKYIESYEEFVKSWIWKHILDHYTKNEDLKDLEERILSAVLTKVEDTLNILKCKDAATFSEFLDNFSQGLQKQLVISKDCLMGLEFKNAFNPGQFSAYVKKVLPELEKQILAEFDVLDIESKLSKLSVKPQDETFKRVFGCGKQCPFCKAPCEAGGSDHKEHFAAVHRPKGLGRYRKIESEKLVYDICSTAVASNVMFKNWDTDWKFHPCKEYRTYYPDWKIQPDLSISASDYWKFIFNEFHHDFARQYNAKLADLPEDWKTITNEQALKALKEIYNMK